MKYTIYIMDCVRQNLGLEAGDTSQDARIENMPRDEVLDMVSTWNNLIGYGNSIRKWVKDIYGVSLN